MQGNDKARVMKRFIKEGSIADNYLVNCDNDDLPHNSLYDLFKLDIHASGIDLCIHVAHSSSSIDLICYMHPNTHVRAKKTPHPAMHVRIFFKNEVRN